MCAVLHVYCNFKTVNGDLINEISYLSCDSSDNMQVFLVGFTL